MALDPHTAQIALLAKPLTVIGDIQGTLLCLQRGEGPIVVGFSLESALKLQAKGHPGPLYVCPASARFDRLLPFFEGTSQPILLVGEDTADHRRHQDHGRQILTAAGHRVICETHAAASRNCPVDILSPHESVKKASQTPSFLETASTPLPSSDLNKAPPSDLDDGTAFLAQLVDRRALFTQKELEGWLERQAAMDPEGDVALWLHQEQISGAALNGDLGEQGRTAVARLLNTSSLVLLGQTGRGQALYTSQAYQQLEQGVIDDIKTLQQRSGQTLTAAQIQQAHDQGQAAESFAYSTEQSDALTFLLGPESLRILTGQAGTGKTTVLKPMVQAFQGQGLTVMGTSFQGKVAEMLARTLNIEGFTLHQLTYAWQQRAQLRHQIAIGDLSAQQGAVLLRSTQAYQLTPAHVIVVDEGNMIPKELWQALLREVTETRARLRIVQDNHQIKTLTGGDISRLLEGFVEAFPLTTIHRQKEPWMKEATALLNQHRVAAGFEQVSRTELFTVSFKSLLHQICPHSRLSAGSPGSSSRSIDDLGLLSARGRRSQRWRA